MTPLSGDRDRAGRVPLHYVALSGDAAIAHDLVRAGADPDSQDRNGFAPLHFAAQSWNVDVAQVLVNAAAIIDIRNGYGNTPLAVAVFNSRGRGELIELLLQAGADPLAANTTGQTPIGLARLIANYDVQRFFVGLDR